MSSNQEGLANLRSQTGQGPQRIQIYDSQRNTIYKREVPALIIPTQLICKVTYVIRTLEDRIAEEFSARLFSTALRTPKSYGPGYKPHRPIPPNWRRNRETPVYRPSDIKIYEQYPLQYRCNLLFIDILKEMGIDPMDWMMVQRKMALSASLFENEPPLRTEAKTWGPAAKSLAEKMSPRWKPAFTMPLCRIVERAMKLSTRESDKIVKMVFPDVFGPLRDSMRIPLF
ncbi:hypothetical protein TWF102_006725 [Orbilia oligospora]|uniref:Uncharacterized protein n=1 Tax=Orbilia oligospora TaxID=2813651 RepID=A0A7C8JJE0_ORBOL|nr:hypothetical protein TWF102_006725 [Orbilia oligospora]